MMTLDELFNKYNDRLTVGEWFLDDVLPDEISNRILTYFIKEIENVEQQKYPEIITMMDDTQAYAFRFNLTKENYQNIFGEIPEIEALETFDYEISGTKSLETPTVIYVYGYES